MEVQDSGVGFKVANAAAGLGFSAMPERLESIEGRLSVESEPGRGAVLVAEAPILPRSASSDTSNGGL